MFTNLLIRALTQCLLCQQRTERFVICNDCIADLPQIKPGCERCGNPLAIRARTCGECLKKAPVYDKLFALFEYIPPVPSMIKKLKFNKQLIYARGFSELLSRKVGSEWYKTQTRPDIIIPIPLHKDRLKERGFNQALEIAKPIAKEFKIPLDLSCRRSKNTLAQSQLPAAKRKQNLKDAFVFSKNYEGLIVAVLDDVVTTGETINSFCTQLRQRGAQKIHIWACARTVN